MQFLSNTESLLKIRVELARELKQSKEERNETDLQNSKNKKLNDEIGKRLAELGLPVTKRYIQNINSYSHHLVKT